MSKLTSDAVHALWLECCFKEGEARDDAIVIDGIVKLFWFQPSRIAENTRTIAELLAQLPPQFHANTGGGWSFLNACLDRNGNQWGEHRDMEALFCLGIAAGKARWQFPRDMWGVLPGGMPYVVVLP